MERAEMKSQLLHENELELPLDGLVVRRKRKLNCMTLTINSTLCLITCAATLVCIVYTSWTINEIGKTTKVIDAMKDVEMGAKNPNTQNYTHLQQAQRQTATHNSTGTSGAINNSVKSTATSRDVQEELDIDFDRPDNPVGSDQTDNESDHDSTSYWNDETSADLLDGSGDYYTDDEESTMGRIKRSVSKSNNNQDSEGTFGISSSKRQRKRKGKKCKGNECRKDKNKRKNRNKKKEVFPSLAQYEATVSDETITKKLPNYDKLVNKNGCDYIDEMKGMLCRSKIFTPIDYKSPLSIFHPTDLVSARKSPLKKVNGSANFNIETDGIILVFSQVTFSTNRPTNGASIVQSRISKGSYPKSNIVQELQCKQGILDHETTSDHRILDEKVSQSCSIIGLLVVKEGDILQIFSNYEGSSLDLSVGSTYFGVVQLTKG